MEAWKAAVLGLVEGVTEYLPVSSTGHLILTERLLGMSQGESESAFAICIQAGAILAVFALYRRRVVDCARGVIGQNPSGFALTTRIVAAFLPAAIVGLAFDKYIKAYLFGLWPVAIAWIVGGLAIFLVKRRGWRDGRGIDQLSIGGALVVGCMQCLAMLPGTSRSLVTIFGGLMVGLSLSAAVEFSFLLGLLTLTAATVFTARKTGAAMLHDIGWDSIAIGLLVAWLSAWVSVRWMIAWLERRGLEIFAWWRIALGLAVAALLAAGRISNT